MSRFDIVIFGASGYTGQYVVEQFAKIAEAEQITWCVAGRNEKKLDNTLSFVSSVTNVDLSNVEKIIASADDRDSLDAMCKQAKVLINCVGPFRQWGEQVVQAAINNGCSHLDISGELKYLEECQLKYHADAQKAGVYVIGAAGADSVPCDLGVEYLASNCDTDLNGVRTFLFFKGGDDSGPANYGTWQSAVYSVTDANLMEPIRQQLYAKKLPKPKHVMERRHYFYNDNINSWAVVMLDPDRSVVVRSQYYHYTVENKRPIQIETHFCVESFLAVVGMAIFGIMFVLLSSFALGRKLLLAYPEIFSFGLFGKEGAPREKVLKRRYELILEGEAYSERIEDPRVKHQNPPDRRVACKVSGPDFGYVNCSICISQCALVVLKESKKLPQGGGVYSPGAAFSHTSLISRLQKQGVTFEMLT